MGSGIVVTKQPMKIERENSMKASGMDADLYALCNRRSSTPKTKAPKHSKTIQPSIVDWEGDEMPIIM